LFRQGRSVRTRI